MEGVEGHFIIGKVGVIYCSLVCGFSGRKKSILQVKAVSYIIWWEITSSPRLLLEPCTTNHIQCTDSFMMFQ